MLFISTIVILGILACFIISAVRGVTINPLVKTICLVLLLISVLVIASPFAIVPANQKGLIFTFGSINDKILDQGLAFRIPFIQKVRLITTQPIQQDILIEVGPNGALTKDNQTIGAHLTFFYKYVTKDLVSMYKSFGEEQIKNLLNTSGMEAFKMAIGSHEIFDLPMNQENIQKTTFTRVKEKMAPYPVDITELRITNYDWSDEFDQQIQQTMHRAQQVKQKEQELLITEQEAHKKVKQAEADKQALITTAEGEKAAAQLRAEAKALEGEGIRRYNESVQKNMELELKFRQLEIEKIKAEKWNGEYVPINNYTPIPLSTGSLLPK